MGFVGPVPAEGLPADVEFPPNQLEAPNEFFHRQSSIQRHELVSAAQAGDGAIALPTIDDVVEPLRRLAVQRRHVIELSASSTASVNSIPFEDVPLLSEIAEALAHRMASGDLEHDRSMADLRIAFGSDDSAIFGASVRGDMAAVSAQRGSMRPVIFTAIYRAHALFANEHRHMATSAFHQRRAQIEQRLVYSTERSIVDPSARQLLVSLLVQEFPELRGNSESTYESFREFLRRAARCAIGGTR